MQVAQNTAFLFDVLSRIQSGMFAPAAMQRPYVWTKQDVLDLFNSLLSGFPIGALLLWSPGVHAPLSRYRKGRLANLTFTTETAQSLILDGQNRLSSLAWALVRDLSSVDPQSIPENERAVWLDGTQLVLDGDSRSFLFIKMEECGALRQFIPAYALLGTSMQSFFMNRLAGHNDELWVDFMDYCDQAQRIILSSKVVVSDLVDATADEAKKAFLMICKAGVPMSPEDFEQSTAWVDEPLNTLGTTVL